MRAGESVEEFLLGLGGEFLVYFTAGRDWLKQGIEIYEGYPGRFTTSATYGRLTEPVRLDYFLAQDDREFYNCERHILLTYGDEGATESESIPPESFP